VVSETGDERIVDHAHHLHIGIYDGEHDISIGKIRLVQGKLRLCKRGEAVFLHSAAFALFAAVAGAPKGGAKRPTPVFVPIFTIDSNNLNSIK